MDATKKPLRIPPEFSVYAEEHGIFDMYKRLLSQLVIDKPNDAIQYTIDWLKRDSNSVPKIAVLGPTASGKSGLSARLSSKTRTVHIHRALLLGDELSSAAAEANRLLGENKSVPDDIWVQLIHERLTRKDCLRRGFLLEDFPQNRHQAIELQSKGILFSHVVVLDAPDTVLVERQSGKRVDRVTGDIYHTTFDWPQDPTVQARLLEPEGISEVETRKKLDDYARHIHGVISAYPSVLKKVNADQPKADVLAQALTFINTHQRTETPRTPRILLIGPTGSGKSTIAQKLAAKYKLVDVSCGALIKEHIANETRLGQAAKDFVWKGDMVPDTLVIKIIVDRLTELDASTRGWVVHGFPLSRDQADGLVDAGIKPNRIYFLDIPDDCVIERLCYRLTDPVTGGRFHTVYNPPLSEGMRQRCIRHPKDSEDAVRAAMSAYHVFAEELSDYYADEGAVRINADQDPQTAFEYVESILVNPLPNKLGEDD